MAAEGQRPARISGRVEGMLPAVEKENWFTHLHSDVPRPSHVRLESVGAAMLETGRSLGGSRERKYRTEQARQPPELSGNGGVSESIGGCGSE